MAVPEVRRGDEKDMEWMVVPGMREDVCKMIHVGGTVYLVSGTEENEARQMLKKLAKERLPEIDDSRIKVIIKEGATGCITGGWHVQIKAAEYIRMLEKANRELEEERKGLWKTVCEQQEICNKLQEGYIKKCYGSYGGPECDDCIVGIGCVDATRRNEARCRRICRKMQKKRSMGK